MKISCDMFLRKDTKIYSNINGGTLMVGFYDERDIKSLEGNKKTLKVFDVVSLSKAKELVEVLNHYIKIAEAAGEKYKGQP